MLAAYRMLGQREKSKKAAIGETAGVDLSNQSGNGLNQSMQLIGILLCHSK
jgi:hypothetical protein